MKLTFCGGAGAVTGASYLLESGDVKILVDCGLHQGNSYTEDQNFQPFPFDPKEISAVFRYARPHRPYRSLAPACEAGIQGDYLFRSADQGFR